MQFIKQNMFMVALAGVVGVGIIVALAASSSLSPDKEWERTHQVSRQLQAIRPPLVNSASVLLAAEDAKEAGEAAEAARQQAIEWNRRNYSIPVLAATVAGKRTQVPAFPFDKETFDNNDLYLALTRHYLDRIEDLRKSLQPTSPPTPQEMQEVEQRARDAAMASAAAAGAGGMLDDDSTRPAPGSVDAAVARDLEGLRIDRAMRGAVYVDPSALHRVFVQPVNSPLQGATPERLWAGLVSLWVQTDIVAAINETNKQVMGQQAKPAVPQAAVKHLLGVEVKEMYIRSPGVVPQGPLEHRAAGGEYAYGFSAQPAGPIDEGGNLTNRACTQSYDVVYYSFRVIMPTRYVLALEKNLLDRNLHTVRKVQMRPPHQDRDRAMHGRETNPYYYGEDAVTEVTFWGELLLLTPWTRGTWDGQAGKWSENYLPLVPHQVIAGQVPQGARRPEDQQRLPSTTGY